jgi:CRP-like cAMP-binding protein
MDYNLLSRCPMFRGMTPAEIEKSLYGVPRQIRKFREGTLIFQSGEQVGSLGIVLSGTVKGEMTDYTGRVIKIEDIPAPGAIAPAFIFGSKNRFPVNVISVSSTELMTIEKQAFLAFLKDNDRILVNFLDMISNRSQFLSEKIKFLNFKTIKSKLAQYILDLPETGKNEVRLDRTQNDLSDYFGVARPSVGRALGDMEEMGLILTSGKSIIIYDRKGLAALTAE